MDWIYLAQGRDLRRAVMDAVLNFWFPQFGILRKDSVLDCEMLCVPSGKALAGRAQTSARTCYQSRLYSAGHIVARSLIYGAGQSVKSLSPCVNTLKESLMVNVAPSTSYE
jgi:hypothetical protein